MVLLKGSTIFIPPLSGVKIVLMKKSLPQLVCLLLSLFFTAQLYAQKYEAENAALSGGAKKVACASCSGGFYVAQEEGKLSFPVSVAEQGFYNITIRAAAPNGDKTNVIAVNGTSSDFFLPKNVQYVSLKVVNTLKLEPGEYQIEISKSWGWINIDYIELEKADVAKRFNLNQTLVTPDPIPEATALFDFLLDNYGEKIISGVMTLSSMDEAKWLKEKTGKEPALLGIDFMHSGRGYNWYNDEEPIQDAEIWYSRNGIPALMWHWRDPLRVTEEFYVKGNAHPNGTTFDISKVSDENSAEYKAMLADIDYIAGLLKKLQDSNVPVIWRPLHEAAGGWFWWGAKGAEPLKQLWILMYNRMVHHHGLQNLIWVWTREPGDDAWYPGDEYVDIIGRDIYKDGDHSSHAIEFNNINALYGGRKMVTLSEVGSFPDPDNLLQDDVAWSWFMPWYGGFTRDSKYNSLELWQKTLAHDYVITLDEMPELSTYERQEPGPEPEPEPNAVRDRKDKDPQLQAYPTKVVDKLTLKSRLNMKSVAVYNSIGALVKQEKVSGRLAVIYLGDLSPGLYIIKVNQHHGLRVLKE